MVRATSIRYKLFTDSMPGAEPAWRFVLQSFDGASLLEASEPEPGFDSDRLDLLALVRGLEALDQPSRLTLITPSRYVRRGLAYGLEDWRRNEWRWESFGLLVPVKNSDLWQRVDQALHFHKLEGRNFRIDPAHPAGMGCETSQGPVARPHFLGVRPRRAAIRVHRLLTDAYENLSWQLSQCGTPLMKRPWLD